MLVLNMKFHKKMYASKALCSLFDFHVLQGLSAFTSDLTLWPEVLIPVPLSNKRHRERGYNQAQLLCDELSRITNIPNLPLLTRTRHTQAQSELNRDQRLENLHGAFVCSANSGISSGTDNKSDISGYRHIAIVDDVITTGATINEACQAVLAAMPHVTISVWCMSLTLAPLAAIAPGETPDAN
jgi:ComF family protein